MNVIVTGANSGIGFETSVALAAMGASVIMTARDGSKGAAAVAAAKERVPGGDLRTMPLDLASFLSVRAFADSVDRVDVLINNAGLIVDRRVLTEDGNEMQFQVNHLGPFLLTNLLLDRLRASKARVVNVSSMTHRSAKLDFDDLQTERRYSGMGVYGRTKLCNVLFTRELAKREPQITANALHPGSVRTGFSGGGDTRLLSIGWKLVSPFLISAKTGAKTSVYLASSPDVAGVTGEYFVRSKKAKASAAALDDESARRLWEVSEELVGLRQPT